MQLPSKQTSAGSTPVRDANFMSQSPWDSQEGTICKVVVAAANAACDSKNKLATIFSANKFYPGLDQPLPVIAKAKSPADLPLCGKRLLRDDHTRSALDEVDPPAHLSATTMAGATASKAFKYICVPKP